MEQKPSVGRIVIVDSMAAVVTKVNENNTLELTVFEPMRVLYKSQVEYSEDQKENTWSWPPRV